MALAEKRQQAEELYAQTSMTCGEIAERLGVNAGTVYKWKSDAAGKGEDWEAKRRLFNLSPMELTATLAQAVKTGILELKKNPDLILDAKKADAMSKFANVLQRLDPRAQYPGAVLDLIRIANRWLAEHKPDLYKQLEPCWDEIYSDLAKYATEKGLMIADLTIDTDVKTTRRRV
jgi:transposase-like protein